MLRTRNKCPPLTKPDNEKYCGTKQELDSHIWVSDMIDAQY